MSSNPKIKTRILLKTGTTNDWQNAANFSPLLGEVCIYTDRFPVYEEDGTTLKYYMPGIKIGDGITNINNLPFIAEDYLTDEEIDNICT